MLLAVKSNHRVINSKQDFNVVVVLPGVTAATVAYSPIDLLGYRVEGPGYIQLWFCKGIKTGVTGELTWTSKKLEFMEICILFLYQSQNNVLDMRDITNCKQKANKHQLLWH